MSGIAGIVNLDGAPADRDLLWRLTRSIAYRGPDAQDVWVEGSVGFGHTMLRTTLEAEREQQPCTLNGELWITADCRIDAREDLIRELEARGRSDAKTATDPELILHAYAVWDTACLAHLTGDFSFALWDARNRRLFCARDQMGIKLLYYARKAGCFICGNTLNSLRLHPAVSDRLNDLAIGDFLLFGHNQDLATTTFADIQRLPPAHMLVLSGTDVRIERYWTLPVDPPLRLGRLDDYAEQFLHLFRAAVRDRMRTSHVGILMSGGLDSTGIAAIALELSRREKAVDLSAHTLVFDRLIPDQERHFAGMAAAHLGIPIHFHAGDDYGFFESCRNTNRTSPEPGFITDFGASPVNAEMAGIAGESRVALYGEGPDNALYYEWKPYFKYELGKGHAGRVLKDIATFPLLFRQIPFWKRRPRVKHTDPPRREIDPLPPWLDADFAKNLHLAERYADFNRGGSSRDVHPVRPQAYQSLSIALWQFVFEWHDPGITGLPLEVRHPFLDIRVLRFLLAVPVIPWCRDKYLLRRAFKKYLPAGIVARRKTGLAGFPAFERWKEIGLPAVLPAGALSGYVDIGPLETTVIDGQELLGMKLRASALAFFLHGVDRACIIRST